MIEVLAGLAVGLSIALVYHLGQISHYLRVISIDLAAIRRRHGN